MKFFCGFVCIALGFQEEHKHNLQLIISKCLSVSAAIFAFGSAGSIKTVSTSSSAALLLRQVLSSYSEESLILFGFLRLQRILNNLILEFQSLC